MTRAIPGHYYYYRLSKCLIGPFLRGGYRWLFKCLCLEKVFNFCYTPFQLRINPFSHRGKVFIHRNVRIHSMSFPEPGTIRIVHAESGHGNASTIYKVGCTGDSDQPAPGAGTDQWAKAFSFEIIREGIA